MRINTNALTGPKCPCGGATEEGLTFCCKCRARHRWNRKKAPDNRDAFDQ